MREGFRLEYCDFVNRMAVCRMHKTPRFHPPENGSIRTSFRRRMYFCLFSREARDPLMVVLPRFLRLHFAFAACRNTHRTVCHPLGVIIKPTRVRGVGYVPGASAQLIASNSPSCTWISSLTSDIILHFSQCPVSRVCLSLATCSAIIPCFVSNQA